MLQRDVGISVFLVVQHRVARGECPPLRILTRDSDVESFCQQCAKCQMLGHPPIDHPLLTFLQRKHRSSITQNSSQSLVERKTFRDGCNGLPHRDNLIHGHPRVSDHGALVGGQKAGPVRSQPIHLLGHVGLAVLVLAVENVVDVLIDLFDLSLVNHAYKKR